MGKRSSVGMTNQYSRNSPFCVYSSHMAGRECGSIHIAENTESAYLMSLIQLSFRRNKENSLNPSVPRRVDPVAVGMCWSGKETRHFFSSSNVQRRIGFRPHRTNGSENHSL